MDRKKLDSALLALYPHYCVFAKRVTPRGEDVVLPSGRHKYQCGRYDCLRNLEVGEMICIGSGDERERGLFRSMASRLGSEYGVRISIKYKNGKIYATRNL